MKRFLIVAAALCLVSAWSVSAEGAADKPKRGGTLTMAIEKELILMNPLVGTRSTDQSIRELMFQSLLALDEKGNLQPKLAESWDISKDGRVYTFKMRRGVKFHSGQEMTAEDAKFAIDYTLNPKNGAYGFSMLRLVDRTEVADKYTLKLTMKSTNPAFLSFLTDIKAFSVIPKGSLQEGVDKPIHYPAGTGPFKFVEWLPRQRIVFERYGEYWGEKVLVDRLILRPVRDATIRLTALRAGDIDVAERSPLEWAKQIADGKLKGISAARASHADLRAILFNVADPPLNNKKLRQALAHAVNRREILNAAYLGFGEPNDQKYPKDHAWHFPGLPWPAYDLEKARALVKESGYRGETIPIITSPEATDQIMALTLQAQLKKIGISIALDTLEVGAYNVRERKGEFALRFRGGDFYPDPWTTYGQDLRCEADLRKRNTNTSGYCDKEMDVLLKSAESELDPSKRKALFRQIMTKVAEDLPEIFVGYVPRFFTFRDHVKGFTTDDAGRFVSWRGGLTHTWSDK